MPSNAHKQFSELMGYVDQLIGIHGKLQQGKGRRHEQDAIHRAGVVMVVAAWEGYVEQVLLESFAAMEKDAGLVVGVAGAAVIPTWARHTFGLRRTELVNALKQFNTPNAENVQRLMREWMQFDPFPGWSWHVKLRRTPSFRPRSTENKRDFYGLLSLLFLVVCRSFRVSKPFRKERTSHAMHCPSSLSVFLGFPILPPQAV